MTRTCSCGREFTPGRGNPKRCPECRAADPHRNGTRAARSRSREMFVCVDGEGRQVGPDTMLMVSFSYGREDGTRGSVFDADGLTGQQVAQWMFAEGLDLPHTADGHRQILIGFHLGWDTAVIGKSFTSNLNIVHKANARRTNLLCQTRLCQGECGKVHRADPVVQQAIITAGGEGELLTLDTRTGIGMSATPGRRLYFEHRPHGDRYDEHRRLDIHDVGSAFVGGLERVIDVWKPEIPAGDRELIAWGKAHRKTVFAGATPEQITGYSEAECVATARTARLLLGAIRDAAHIEMKPSHLYGSGSIAAAAMAHYGVPKRDKSATTEDEIKGVRIDDIPHLTYFGGMIEAPVIGLISGAIYEMDICSAYPYAMTELPCMRSGHGEWKLAKRTSAKTEKVLAAMPDGTVGHVQVLWANRKGVLHPPFIVRRKSGAVAQPLSGNDTWVTLVEYQAGKCQFPGDVHLKAAVWWETSCDCPPPFAWLADLYKARLDLKVAMSFTEKGSDEWQALNCRQEAIKLIINSVYGKLAQTRPEPGPYTNLHFASYITGRTRTTVRTRSWAEEALGNTVVYQHTDSVLTVGSEPDQGSSDLGAWKREKDSHDMFVAQPGLAVSLGGGKAATRGVAEDAFRAAATSYVASVDLTVHPADWPTMTVPRTVMLSRRMAIHQNRPEAAGTFQSAPVHLTLGGAKRDVTRARQVPQMASAWVMPPVYVVEDPADLEDIRSFKAQMAAARDSGEFDWESASWEDTEIIFDDLPDIDPDFG
jgi:hypothetical protein